jgi:hypothetical protein
VTSKEAATSRSSHEASSSAMVGTVVSSCVNVEGALVSTVEVGVTVVASVSGVPVELPPGC